MSISAEDFIAEVTRIQENIRDEHMTNSEHTALCHVMHREVGLTETKAENADEMVKLLKEQNANDDADPDSIDFTQEHAVLHHWLSAVQRDAIFAGLSGSQLLAAMFVIGRRYGMREVARVTEGGIDVPDALPEGW